MSKKVIWDYFKAKGFTDCGVAGLMGNLYAESAFKANNLQSTGNTKLKMTDEEYTKAVDSGKYTYDQFCKDSHGYGLAQWTYHTRKASLYNYAKKCGKSIGDLQMQLDFLWSELKNYKEVVAVLTKAKTVREASDVVMTKYERPADQSEKAKQKRANYGDSIYAEFCVSKVLAINVPMLRKGCKGAAVKALQAILNVSGFPCGNADGDFGNNTEKAVKAFQVKMKLDSDGIVGLDTWTELLNG